MLRKTMFAAATALLPAAAWTTPIDVTDADIQAGANVVWTSDNEYVPA